MNFYLIVITIFLFVNSILSLSIVRNEFGSTANTIQNDKYNYNLTDSELIRTDQIDIYDFERMEKRCCAFARLAARRGFLCNLKFYQNKFLYRITNRIHRKHVQLVGKGRQQLVNKQLMVTIGKCYDDGFIDIFENCCWDEIEKEMEY